MTELRKEAFEVIKKYREDFVDIVLRKNGIKFNPKMTTRQKREMLDKKLIGIIRDDRNETDKIYREGNLIAYWSRDYKFSFKRGKFLVTIEYKIF